ncbi:MAG TPA: SPOR domain-containing protein [Burkholderiales bacterium]|nr:SPOR domain-containing protein [Burkholderiales bacterium]
MAEAAQDVETLKRRGRRRLVGAVALVLAAVIVLPMVFDPEPKRADVAVNVRIPGENETQFAPKVAPKAPEQRIVVEEKKAEEKSEEGKKLAGTEFMVPVGAFTNPDGVIAKLSAARVPYYTEAAKGNLTRVRAGPFPSREAAEKALKQLKGMGLDPGTVTAKAG